MQKTGIQALDTQQFLYRTITNIIREIDHKPLTCKRQNAYLL